MKEKQRLEEDCMVVDVDDTNETTRLHKFHLDNVDGSPVKVAVQSRSPGYKKRIIRITLSIVAHVCLVAVLAILFWLLSQNGVPNRTPYLIACGATAGVLYILILIEANFSNTLASLRSFTTSTTISAYVGQVLDARPEITWYATCFHYSKNRSDKIYLTEQDTGDAISGKKVVTREEKKDFKFSSWKEVGRDIRDFVSDGIIRLECSKVFIFRDEASKANYMQQYTSFREQCGHMDRFVTHKEVFHIQGFRGRVTAGLHSTHRPVLLREPCYWLFTALLFTWPYRALYRLKTSKVYMITIKEIGS